MRLAKKLNRFVRNERGQSTIEYILILFVVIVIASKFKDIITDRMENASNKIGDKIDSVLSDDF